MKVSFTKCYFIKEIINLIKKHMQYNDAGEYFLYDAAHIPLQNTIPLL